MPEATYSPVVLVIEDDPPYADYICRGFLEETSVGVLLARDLKESRRYVDEKDVKFDAVLADLYFVDGADDAEHELYDGVDILAYCKRARPKAIPYVMSVLSDRPVYHEEADKEGIEVRRWFSKELYPKRHERSPWATMERHFIQARAKLDDEVTNELRSKIIPTRRTYMRELLLEGEETRLTVLKPIEVICSQEHDADEETGLRVEASAPRLGLLVPGVGGSVEEALADLAVVIADHVEQFSAMPDGSLVGYAALVNQRLQEHVATREG